LHPSRKIIEIIARDAGLGPFHDPRNAPLILATAQSAAPRAREEDR
jgi:hypothetical protein